MFKAWAVSADDAQTLSKLIEAHLNEFAEEVVSVSYCVDEGHHALAVYKPVGSSDETGVEAALAVAERIVDEGRHQDT